MNEQELDKKVKLYLETEPRKFTFKLTDIIEKIEAPYLTKNDEQLFLYKQIRSTKHLTPTASNISVVYFIVNENGEICGKIPVTINEFPTHASMDYWIKPKFQGQGIGSVAVASAINHLFTSGELDGIEYNTPNGKTKTRLEEIQLDINTNNIPSRKLASKLGFIEDSHAPTTFLLTKDDYLKSKNKSEETGEKL